MAAAILSRHPAGVVSGNVPRASRRCCVRVSARKGGATSDPYAFNYNIHGRHVEVNDQIESYVKQRMGGVLDHLRGAEYIEGEGGLRTVDVRLMNSSAEVTLIPTYVNKHLHDTYLRQGKLTASANGSDLYDALDNTVDVLERKLKKLSKEPPFKKDLRRGSPQHQGLRK